MASPPPDQQPEKRVAAAEAGSAETGSAEAGSGGAGEPAAVEADEAAADVLRWRRVFAGEERQLREVRCWVASVLPPGPARDDVVSVAAELGANAVRHTASGRGGKFAVEVTWQQTVLRVAVADGGGPAEPLVIDEPAGEHGRGLLLVRGLSVRLGVEGDQQGRLVWAEIPWDASP